MPRKKRYQTNFTLDQCKTQLNVFNGKAFLNLQLPDGRWIVFQSVDGRTIPEFIPVENNPKEEGKK